MRPYSRPNQRSRILQASILVAVFVVMISAAVGAAETTSNAGGGGGDQTDTGLEKYIDKGTVENELTIEVPDNYYAYYEAKVAELPIGPNVGETWKGVQAKNPSHRVEDVWNLAFGGDPILFEGTGTFDISRLSQGRYALLVWACEAGGKAPQNCRWLEPRVFSTEGGFTIPDGVLLSAHMGAGENGKGLAPENTITAFDLTLNEIGLNSVEFDVRTAKDGYVVFHDPDTKTIVGESYDLAKESISTLRELSPTNNYEAVDSEYALPESEAAETRIPTYEEALDYLRGTDAVARIELKGEIRGSKKLGREVYEKVSARGMTDQVIFLSFEGSCNTRILQTERYCTYPGLEAIEEASNGRAQTAILWQARKNPNKYGGLSNLVELPPKNALEEAEKKNIDIFAPRVQKKYGWEELDVTYREVGLAAYDMTAEDFVEKANSRGLDYSFMNYKNFTNPDQSPTQKRKEQLELGVEWLSTNRPDRLKESVQKIMNERDFNYNQ